MTINLYVTSTQDFSGKSAVCVTLLHRLQKDGYTVGYLKPFSSAARVLSESSMDEDARFIKEMFKLAEPLETLAPVILTNQQVHQIFEQGGADYEQIVKQAAQKVAEGKNIVVMEGSANFREGRIVNLAPSQAADLLNAKVVTVIGYKDLLQVVDDMLTAQARLEKHLVGVIVNNVPTTQMEYVNSKIKPYVQKLGINLLAVLPHEKTLHSITVREIAEALESELICASQCGDELVENLLVGAMNVEAALNYFRRATNKAVIVGVDRPDMQLAAMETSTKALILTGNIRPNPMIEARAEERGIAIILSQFDTLATVEKVEKFFGKARIHQAEKVQRFEELLAQHLDFKAFYQLIGLSK